MAATSVKRRTITEYVEATEHGVTLTVFGCADCGIPFGLPSFLDNRRRDDGQPLHCPNGHTMSYQKGTIEDQLRRRAEQAEREAARAVELQEAAEARTARARADLRATHRRAAAGLCPAGCRRHFTNLDRHLDTKHPGWKAQQGVGQVLVDGPYGTMRRRDDTGRWYDCACGAQVATAGGRAAKHARTCKAARLPWPVTQEGGN